MVGKLKLWYISYSGSLKGTLLAKTEASALRKARRQWGSRGKVRVRGVKL
jgi:hypothetical protein